MGIIRDHHDWPLVASVPAPTVAVGDGLPVWDGVQKTLVMNGGTSNWRWRYMTEGVT
jgi:hypothetical protein